jgi:uncharacterized protein
MEALISNKLREIETMHGVSILYACETGSRAWGFASPDSDYDIRFIYVHPKDWYLSLSQRRDSIEVPIKEDLDITGWDIRKSLQLLKKSNASLIERFQSPVEYFSSPGLKDEFRQLINSYYSPTAVFYHHYSLAKKFWEDLQDRSEVKLKNYFYLLRSLLSCYWITMETSVLPMHMDGLMNIAKPHQCEQIRKLIGIKKAVGEKYMHQWDDDMATIVTELWRHVESNKTGLGVNGQDYSLLDDFFLKTLEKC